MSFKFFNSIPSARTQHNWPIWPMRHNKRRGRVKKKNDRPTARNAILGLESWIRIYRINQSINQSSSHQALPPPTALTFIDSQWLAWLGTPDEQSLRGRLTLMTRHSFIDRDHWPLTVRWPLTIDPLMMIGDDAPSCRLWFAARSARKSTAVNSQQSTVNKNQLSSQAVKQQPVRQPTSINKSSQVLNLVWVSQVKSSFNFIVKL